MSIPTESDMKILYNKLLPPGYSLMSPPFTLENIYENK